MSYMIHQIEIGKIHIDSTITVEFTPMDENVIYGLLLDHERIPIPKKYEHAAIVSLKDNVFERKVTKMLGEGLVDPAFFRSRFNSIRFCFKIINLI